MARTLLIGTGNLDKARELEALLSGLPVEVKGLADFRGVAAPEETEDSFEGNALLKAQYYHERFGVWCVADDSGLEVEALDGAPGVYSARYAGEDCSYEDNNLKLLKVLEDAPGEKRRARFVCCAALAGEGIARAVRGTVEGRIAFECRGSNGFGYDPLFIPQGGEKTFGEMEPEEKQRLSHRANAFTKMRTVLESLL